MYRVTIHEHRIYDTYVAADSKEDAEDIAVNAITEDDRSQWTEDVNAGWVEVGEIYDPNYGES